MNDCTTSCPPPSPLPLGLSTELDPALANEQLATYAKALGHPVRVQLLKMLAARTTCVYGDLRDELPLAQSTVSQHLKVLKDAGLIRGTLTGPRTCYCVEPTALAALKALVAAL